MFVLTSWISMLITLSNQTYFGRLRICFFTQVFPQKGATNVKVQMTLSWFLFDSVVML